MKFQQTFISLHFHPIWFHPDGNALFESAFLATLPIGGINVAPIDNSIFENDSTFERRFFSRMNWPTKEISAARTNASTTVMFVIASILNVTNETFAKSWFHFFSKYSLIFFKSVQCSVYAEGLFSLRHNENCWTMITLTFWMSFWFDDLLSI